MYDFKNIFFWLQKEYMFIAINKKTVENLKKENATLNSYS